MIRKISYFPMLVILISAAALGTWAILSSRPAAADPAPVQSSNGDSAVNLRRTVTVQVVNKTKDAVVNISTRKVVDRHVTMSGGFFMNPIDTGEVVHVPLSSLGSGFIIHKDGYVVTNNHVVDKAREISVELADGRKLPADLISADPDADLAILHIKSDKPFPTLDLGESSDLMIGEPVIAVGNPLGFSHSVSTGIVSALHRDIDSKPEQPNDQPVHGEDAALRDLVQTDAAINPGNSGGPLLNAYGQVIGINTAIRGDAQNIGFAIPINRLRDLIPELMNPSQVTKVDVPLKLAEKRTITEPATINVWVVSAAQPPAVLQAVNGQHPNNIIDAYAMMLKLKPNQPLDVSWADNKTQQLVTRATPIPDAILQAKQRFGLSIEQVTPMMADKFQLNQEEGLLIDGVERDSPAAKSGLDAGDIIVQVGKVRVASLEDFGALVPRLPETGSVRVWVVRGQAMGYITLRY